MSNKRKFTRKHFLIGSVGAVAATGSIGAAYRFFGATPKNSQITVDYHGPVAALSDIIAAPPFDVCIIGTGPAGTALGIDLARQGLSTLILDSGCNLSEVYADERYRELEVFENSGTITYPIATSRIRALGGTSNIWTGRCARLHPIDFSDNAYTPAGASWPFTYNEFEPYYARAEETLRVQGGTLSDFHAPRSGPLPIYHERHIEGLKSTMKHIGITVDDSPTSKSRDYPGTMRIGRDLLPILTALPNASLLTGITVTRLVSDDSGRIVHAEVKDLKKMSHTIRARVFIVAGGAMASARLLLLSVSRRFPRGLGNNHDLVGRYFNEHPDLTFTGDIPATAHEFLKKNELSRCHQFYDEFKKQGLGSILLVFYHGAIEGNPDRVRLQIGATLEMEPVAKNRVTLDPARKDYFGNPITNVSLSFSARDKATIAAARALIREIYAKLNAVNMTEGGLSWSHHHIGTCRMGNNPATSVVDASLKVHGTANLHVLTSGNFVTGGASHPTLAIVGLAHRLSDYLAKVFSEGRISSSRIQETTSNGE